MYLKPAPDFFASWKKPWFTVNGTTMYTVSTPAAFIVATAAADSMLLRGGVLADERVDLDLLRDRVAGLLQLAPRRVSPAALIAGSFPERMPIFAVFGIGSLLRDVGRRSWPLVLGRHAQAHEVLPRGLLESPYTDSP